MTTYAEQLWARSAKPFTSAEILAADDLYAAQELASSGVPIQYQLTESEIGWLNFIQGKYSIADYVNDNRDGDILTIHCSQEMSEALDNDCAGWGKATMLSDDTALQRMFFWLYQETD